MWWTMYCAVSFVLGIVLSSFLWKREETRKTRRPAGDTLGDVDYARSTRAMTDTQQTLYRMLLYLYRDKYILLAKTSAEAIVDLPNGMSRKQFHIDRLRSKPIDFVLCETERSTPLLVIMIEDGQRDSDDTFIDDLINEIELPVLRIKPAKNYLPNDVAEKVRQAIESFREQQGGSRKSNAELTESAVGK